MTTPAFDPRRWHKSTFSGDNGGCVEINDSVTGTRGVRDSKLGDASPILVFPATAFAYFLSDVPPLPS